MSIFFSTLLRVRLEDQYDFHVCMVHAADCIQLESESEDF